MLCRGLEPSLPRVPSRDQRLSRKSLTRAEAATASRPLTPHPSQQPIRTNQTSALPGSNGGGPTCARSGATEREGTQSPCLVPAPCPSSCFYPPPRAFTVDASLGAHAARIATTARVKQQGPALHTRFSHPSRPLFRCPGRRTLLVERVPVSWQMARLLRSDYVQTGTSATDCVVQVNSDQFQFQFVYSQPIRIDFCRCTQVRGWQPSAAQTLIRLGLALCHHFYRGAAWPSTTDHPLCPRFSPRPAASTASSIRVLYILLHILAETRTVIQTT